MMKPLWQMSSREIEEMEHKQKRETIPLPSLDTVRKAFEVCFSGGLPQRCVECPYHRNGCTSERERDAMDIINAQAERIAQLEKPKYIDWELENLPHVYDKPRCDEMIDRQTLTHVICNVDCPEGVDHDTFIKVLNEVAETLNKFPYFKVEVE